MKNLTTFTMLIMSALYSTLFSQVALDPTFGAGGIVTTSYPGVNEGEDVAIQADGKIVLVGTSTDTDQNMRIIRYLDDGSIDTSFGSGGSVELTGLSLQARAIAIQSDQKILVSGTSYSASIPRIFVARLKTDGSLDSTFSLDGLAVIQVGSFGCGSNSILVLPNDKIILGGWVVQNGNKNLSIHRINANGTNDTSFGTIGSRIIDYGNEDQVAEFVLLQNDGKLVAGGTHGTSGFTDIILARVSSNGTIDNSFGTNGIVLTDVMLGNDRASSGAVQADGKIVVVGDAELNSGPTTNIDFCTIRYNTNGTIDTSFGSSGIISGDLDGGEDIGTSVAIQGDSRIVVAGNGIIGGTSNQFGMIRYWPDGTLDNTFGVGGKLITDIGGAEDRCNAMTTDQFGNDQIILVGESSDASGDSDFALARYSITNGLQEHSNEQRLLQVYPNPVTEQSIVKYSLSQTEKVTIRLYNLRGDVVHIVLDSTPQEQGEHEVLLELENGLSHGNYVLEVETSSSSTSIEIHI